jgi:hypothetical protein
MQRGMRVRSGLFAACLLAGLAGSAQAARAPAVPPPEYEFSLAADDAEIALKKFARQARRQVIYGTDVVSGIETNAVTGRYGALAALDLMLSGTPLLTREDAATGALAIVRTARTPPRIVQLPPYVVEDSSPVTWRYARVPGVEILSRVSDATTRQLLVQDQRLRWLLELILPARLQARFDTPDAYVVYHRDSVPPVSRDIIDELRRKDLEQGRGGAATWSVQVLPNYRFHDRDAQAIFFILDDLSFTRGNLTLTPGYMRYLLQTRIPTLPAWFVEGFLELYPGVMLETAPQLTAVDLPLEVQTRGASGLVTLRPLRWVNDAETLALRKHPRRRADLPPVTTLFAGKPVGDPEAVRLWRNHAALFIRWALDEGVGAKRPALWDFVDQCSHEPVTEGLFARCFGLSYAEADEQLGDYLPAAVRNPLHVLPRDMPPALEVQLSNATELESSRVQGALQHMEIAYVRELYPELASKYIEQARNTLGRAYRSGQRDPRLLALLGLTECDAGNDAAALPFLEAAVAASVVRPRAYYELARIKYAAIRPAEPDEKFPASVAADVRQLLHTACLQAPALPEVYELLAEIWLRSDLPPGPEEFAMLDTGLRHFPRHFRLLYTAALLHALHGDAEVARSFAQRSRESAATPAEQAQIDRLASALLTRLGGNGP